MDWQLPRTSRFSNLDVFNYVYYPCMRMRAFVKLELGLGNWLYLYPCRYTFPCAKMSTLGGPAYIIFLSPGLFAPFFPPRKLFS
uniref:Uncharacterized protein n=1 Tax=Picea glauca TaxID=3330 RepID=A0A101LXZ5_PICGL|nr:hypothetical protein ABT39_MTgene5565 [Picea glauca]QHR89562.1 hypothetical protein Q903MT_gene3584 [Picea sitchensis]